MTKDVAQNWHRNISAEANELTVRLGQPFAELSSWVIERELELPLEVSYRILGLDPFTVAIGNLVKELSHPESQLIISEWETNPIVNELKKLTQAVTADTNISRKYASIGHRGGVNKNRDQFRNYANKTFLLTLITNPLSDVTDETTYTNRRRLRIWLLVQAASRLLDFGYSADRGISIAARFLVIDAADANWILIDDLLKKAKNQLGSTPNTYERFTSALANASHIIKNDSFKPGKTATQFLNAINSIAHGECREIEASTNDIKALPRLTALLPAVVNPLRGKTDPDDDDFTIIAPGEQDEEPLFYVTDIDPTDSAAQQAISSGSVYIQNMELSHYLPWSWDRVLPSESQALEEWLNKQLRSRDMVDRTGAALVWLAMHLSRSLVMVERLTIESKLKDEWSFSTDFDVLKRTSPRRRSAWKPNETTRQQVHAFRDDLIVLVPQPIQDILRTAASNAVEAPQIIRTLWQAVSQQKLDTWFNEQAREHFPRLTSAKLANYQPQRLFDATGEFNFARLLTSHSNSALPGACSYATWDIKAIEKGFPLPVVESSPGEPASTYIIGSMLIPLESVLHEEVTRCNTILKQTSDKGLIQYHNVLTQYVVMALYAGTGARPLRDPFESLQHFSFQHRCVFINDKNDGTLHTGRVVPLPADLIALLTYYLEFLKKLSLQVATHREELALQISALINGREASMPFFFLLDGNLRWHSMSDAVQLECALFEWTLPANLFRHRYAQRLLKEGIDPEVVDGFMGHGERGAATYSDYSVRCWEDDARRYQSAMDNIYSELPFATPLDLQELPPLLCLPAEKVSYVEPKLFGQKDRVRYRSLRLKKAIREAHADIRLFLNSREIQSISDDELLLLSNRMLLRENRLPHPQAAIRFNILVKTLKRSEANSTAVKENEQQPDITASNDIASNEASSGLSKRQLLSKRFVELRDERTHITPRITNALELYTQLESWADVTRKNTLKTGLSMPRALCIGTVLVAIEKRLGYKQLLLDVMAGQNFRLLQNKRHYFLEYSEILDPEDFSVAVQRHELSYKTISLLAHGMHKRKTVEKLQPHQINEFKALLEIYSKDNSVSCAPTMEELLSWLCDIINQSNLVQLPGIVAAALSERAPPTSSSLRDYERLLNGRALDLPIDTTENTEWPNSTLPNVRDRNTDKLSLQGQAKDLSKNIAIVLQGYKTAKASECAKNLRSICNTYKNKVSSSMMLLGYWIADLTATGKSKNRKEIDPYALKSLTTYFSSLSPVFRELLYEVDLFELDSEEITNLCVQMIDYKITSSKHADYFGKRLKDFFRWAARFGVASPEWADLDLGSGYRTVSAGLISEAEYQICQTRILTDSTLTQDEQLILGFVLLTTYRFGLRLNEAVCMLRRDWCQYEQLSWVLVQGNQYRALKSQASRRAIPLLFKLSENEQNIVDRTLARYTSIAGEKGNRPILCEASNQESGQPVLTRLAPRISQALILLMRSVTGNPQSVLHHCRHSFYNRVATALFGLNNPLADRLTSTAEHDQIRRIVLGPVSHVSRRGSMALARLMGHRFPSTGLKNYFHLTTEWSNELTPVTHLRAHKIKNVLQVSEQSVVTIEPAQNMAEALTYSKPTLSRLLQALRLVSLGMSYERVGELIQIETQHISRLQSIFDLTNTRMRFSSAVDKNLKLKGKDCPNALLESLTDSAWQRLLHRADELGDNVTVPMNANLANLLKDLPYIVSPNRHILMEQPEHFELVQHVVALFDVPLKQYKIIVKEGRHSVLERWASVDLNVVTEVEAGIKLDGFTIFLPERNSHYQIKDYAGVVLSRSATGFIRNSFDLVIAVLTIGFLIHLETGF